MEAAIPPIIVGTRGSTLALIQAQRVVDLLRVQAPDQSFELRTVRTLGDRVQTLALSQFGTTGVFVRELDQMLVDGTIDMAVHSLKDVPPDLIPGVVVAAYPERADPRDVLVVRPKVTLAELSSGSRVGTSSVRRLAQLRSLRPDLDYRDDLRGNVETRLRKLYEGSYEAVVLAAAGLIRLGRSDDITEYLDVEQCLPDAGQGTLAVSARLNDPVVGSLLRRIDDPLIRAVSLAERGVLTAFGGGCKIPVAAFAEIIGTEIDLRALVATVSGSTVIRARKRGPIKDPDRLGQDVWQRLVESGALAVLGSAERG